MSVTGTCPRCGDDQAQFLNIDSNHNVAVDCSGSGGCNYQGATPLEKAIELIDDNQFPITFR